MEAPSSGWCSRSAAGRFATWRRIPRGKRTCWGLDARLRRTLLACDRVRFSVCYKLLDASGRTRVAIGFPNRAIALLFLAEICYFLTRTNMAEPTQHVPVMAAEVLEWLRPAAGQTFVDGTLGGGGHTRLLAEAVGPNGLVIALDRDPAAVERTAQTLTGLSVRAIAANYSDIPEVLAGLNVNAVDGILLDLGLSSDQLADADRGFSFQSNGTLDLRFDTERGEPAWKLLQRLSAEHLADLIF